LKSVSAALLILTLLVITPHSLSEQTEVSGALSIVVAPPKLPADGGYYDAIVVQIIDKSGLPIPAPEDIVVTLSSSRTEVGSVDPYVTIPKGSSYAVAGFRTTLTPGQTEVTASASGYQPDTKSLATVEPSGSPKLLSVSLSPSQMLPEAGASGIVTVQLLDATGKPARAESDVVVTLSSSITRVGSVDPTLTIKAGSTFGRARFYVSYSVGETTITASAAGYSSGSATLRVVGPIPAKLAIYAAPPKIPERSESYSYIVVQIQDLQGSPAKAPSDISVHLSSSNEKIAYLQDAVLKIPSGKTYAATKLYGVSAGSVRITASAEGYTSASTEVVVVKPTLGKAGRLGLYLAPPSIPPGAEYHEIIVLQLQDSAGNPLISTEEVTAHLTSSDTSVGSVNASVKLSGGAPKLVGFTSTLLPGTTVITASAQNFETAAAQLTVTGTVPYRLALTSAPTLLPADGGSYDSIIVELQDVKGLPARAPTNITVFLSSSRTDIGEVSKTVTIAAGRTYAVASFKTTYTAGATNITATALGYASASRTIYTVSPAPTHLAVYTAPSTLQAIAGAYESIIVQLQDASGVPSKARSDITIMLSSSALNVGSVDEKVVLKAGSTYVKARFYTTGVAGETTITATQSGFTKGSATIKTVLLPIALELYTQPPLASGRVTVRVFQPVLVQAYVKCFGKPLEGAAVLWDVAKPQLLNESRLTDQRGYASAVFLPAVDGNITLTVSVSKSGYTTVTKSVAFEVKPLAMKASLNAEKSGVEVGEPITLVVTVASDVGAVEGASLTWSTNLGSLAQTSSSTDREGKGRAVFFSNTPGSAEIRVDVKKEGYTSTQASLKINVMAPQQPAPTPSESPPLTLWASVAAVVAVIIGALVFIRRRRVAPKVEEETI
jgi:hypothetical protein